MKCIEQSLRYLWQCPICRTVPPRNYRISLSKELAVEIRERSDPEEYQRLKDLLIGPLPPNLVYFDEFPPVKRQDDYFIKIKYGNTYKAQLYLPKIALLSFGRRS